nr:MAG TPA: hypothetical protein [Caudoviricetes sp.]
MKSISDRVLFQYMPYTFSTYYFTLFAHFNQRPLLS